MKQVIQIESDSDEICQEPSTQRRKITLIQDQTNLEWKIDCRLRQVSSYLQIMEQQTDQEADSIITARISKYLTVNESILTLITTFYQQHDFNMENIQVAKINTDGFQKALDPSSLRFLDKYLVQQSEESLKNLFNLCQFLKFNGLKQVVSVYLASQHFFNFNDFQMKKELQEKEAYFSRQQMIHLKSRMKKYAQHLSLQLLQKLKSKYDEQNRK